MIPCGMADSPEAIPSDINALKAALLAERAARRESDARAAGAEAMVAHLKLMIAKLKRDRFDASSERGRKLLDQLEMQLEEAETAAAEDAAIAERGSSETTTAVRAFRRAKPVRAPLPAHLPRERVVLPSPTECPCCGGMLSKLGETITESLESIPRSYKVIQTVREKFSCRSCETITQPAAPFHPIARGRAGPNLLATIMHDKFGAHQPLNRQSERFACEGIELSVSTLADWVGACAAALAPLVVLIQAHVLAAERIHGDDTTVPVLAKCKTHIARLWGYVRDDRPFGGSAAPAAMFFYSRDRGGWTSGSPPGGLCRHSASRRLCRVQRSLSCRAPASSDRRSCVLGSRAPQGVRAGRCRQSTGCHRGSASHGRDLRHGAGESTGFLPRSVLPRATRRSRRSSRNSSAGCAACAAECHDIPMSRKAMDYMLKRWEAFTRFLGDGRICLTNNAAERELRRVALGRKSWLFAGSDRGGERAAAMYSLIATAKLNQVDPRAWLADVLARIADQPVSRWHELLPWNWKPPVQFSALPDMAAISYVFTLVRVAKMLGEDEDLLRRIADDMDPEDGCLWVLGPDETDSTIAFTPFGIENLKQLLEDYKERG